MVMATMIMHPVTVRRDVTTMIRLLTVGVKMTTTRTAKQTISAGDDAEETKEIDDVDTAL